MDWNWWVLLTGLVAWLLQNVVHEGSHAVVAKLRHKDVIITGFFPLPVWLYKGQGAFWKPWAPKTRPWPGAHLHMAGITWDRMPGQRPWVHFAPHFGGAAMVLLTLPLFILADPSWRLLVLPFLIAPVVDVGNWWRTYFWGSKHTDGKKWRRSRSA